MPHVSSSGGDDLASTDEVKVYKDEGEEEDTSPENLAEDKVGLVTETEEGKPPDSSNGEYSGSDKDGNVKSSDNPNDRRIWNPLLSPYPYHSNGATLPPTSLGPPGFTASLFPYNDRPFGSPPPAHMGISPVHIDPKTGLPRPMYPIPPPPGQFPFYPDLSAVQWSGPGGYPITSTGLRGPYPPLSSSPLSRFSPPGLLPPHPGLPPGFPHPGLVHPGPKQELPSVTDAHRLAFNNHHPEAGRGVMNNNQKAAAKKKPYVKKPLNAFMLFMKEMRQKVIDDCTLKESAAINQILGRKWHSLDRSEQAKYYEMARKEKELHLQLYPGWSARDNYGTHTKKKKRKKGMDSDLNSNDSGRSVCDNALYQLTNDECANPKKCRARFGLDQQHQWCKPCRSDMSESFSENGESAMLGRDLAGSPLDVKPLLVQPLSGTTHPQQQPPSHHLQPPPHHQPQPISTSSDLRKKKCIRFLEEGGVYSDDDDDDNHGSVASTNDDFDSVHGNSPQPSSSSSHTDENRNHTTDSRLHLTGGHTDSPSKRNSNHSGGNHAVVQTPSSSLFHIGPLPEASSHNPRGHQNVPGNLSASSLVTSSMVLAT